MSVIARFKIITKIFVVLVLLSTIAGTISWLGIHALASLNESADNMSFNARRALETARANQNVIALSRAEFRVALDPSLESRAAVHGVIDEQMKLFDERLNSIARSRDQQALNMLPGVKEAMAEYQRGLQNTLSLADRVKNQQLSLPQRPRPRNTKPPPGF
jgi:methyl-accepting chemotaxis protein